MQSSARASADFMFGEGLRLPPFAKEAKGGAPGNPFLFNPPDLLELLKFREGPDRSGRWLGRENQHVGIG